MSDTPDTLVTSLRSRRGLRLRRSGHPAPADAADFDETTALAPITFTPERPAGLVRVHDALVRG